MWTFLGGCFLFVGLAMGALCLGQGARRRFPKIYAAFNQALFGVELLFIIAVFFGLFYMTL
jgi:hypothetical protein